MIRRYGEPKIKGISYQARPGAYAILPRNGSLLVTHQTSPKSEFQLPGGGIDKGESPIAALHREVMEETGWRISTPVFSHAFRRYVYMPNYDMWAEKICSIFIAKPVRRLGPPTEVDHQPIWMPISDARRCVGNPGDKAAISRCFGLHTLKE